MATAKPHASGTSPEDFDKGENPVGRIVALIAGAILLITGVALGVTIVLLPVGVPVAILGLALCVAAVGLGRNREK